MRVLGISGAFGHDAAAALVVDGTVVASSEEERHNRIKRSPKLQAVNASLACLSQAGLDLEDLDVIALGWDPSLAPADSRLTQNREAFLGDYRWSGRQMPEVVHVPHHQAHAASAWYMAGLEEATVLVLDGQGEDVSTTWYSASPDGLRETARYGIPASLGFFYAAMTRYLGFSPGSAGKVMGLAAYGNPTHDFPELDFTPGAPGITVPGPEDKLHRMRWWLAHLAETFGPPGRPGSGTLPPRHLRDAAASAQAALERSVLQLARTAVTGSQSRSLVLSGGVALNCSANGRLKESGIVDDLFVFGPAHDGGTALGAAVHLAAAAGEPLSRTRRQDAFLGATYPIGATLDQARRLGLAVLEGAGVESAAANLIGADAVGGWFRGRAELGPRALGARSIVARADSTSVRDRVNAMKNREQWRPLAPALTRRGAERLGLEDYRFMIEAVWLPYEQTQTWREELSGVLHADDSMRPLVVDDRSHPFHGLLEAMESRHDAMAVINTSFNNEREPIVETPGDALRTFASSGLDFLVLEDVLLTKPK